MSTDPRATPQLDGYEIQGLAPRNPVETAEELAQIQRLAGGLSRKQGRYWGPALPDRQIVHRWTVEYSDARHHRRLLSSLRSRPGTHTWTLWRREELSWSGDNVLTEIALPWPHAPWVTTLPSIDPLGVHFALEASLAPDWATPLVVVEVTAATYDGAGSPAAGELWVDTEAGGQRARLASPLLLGEVLYVSMVPLYTVLIGDSSPTAQELQMGRAPARLELRETSA